MRATYLSVAQMAQNTLGASAGGIIGSIIIRELDSAALLKISGLAIMGLVVFFLSAVKNENKASSLIPQ
jgi:hypothetical protein